MIARNRCVGYSPGGAVGDTNDDGRAIARASQNRDAAQGSGAMSRRRFLRTGAVGSAAGPFAAVGLGFAARRRAWAQSSLAPDEALAQLLDGNRRYVEQRLRSLNEDLDILKQKTVEKQEPFATVLSCADSRVPVELVFDQSIGHVFVARVAGNVASSEIIATVEYGAMVLGTRVVMVMGHGNCGAVKAAIEAKAAPGQISALYRYIRPAIDEAGSDVDAAVRANARIQAKLLRDSSPVLAELAKRGKVKVVASYYELSSGKVTLLE